MIVARLESSMDITKLVSGLESLNYEVIEQGKKILYVYRKDSNSSQLKSDIKSVKSANNISTSIKAIYGSITLSV